MFNMRSTSYYDPRWEYWWTWQSMRSSAFLSSTDVNLRNPCPRRSWPCWPIVFFISSVIELSFVKHMNIFCFASNSLKSICSEYIQVFEYLKILQFSNILKNPPTFVIFFIICWRISSLTGSNWNCIRELALGKWLCSGSISNSLTVLILENI